MTICSWNVESPERRWISGVHISAGSGATELAFRGDSLCRHSIFACAIHVYERHNGSEICTQEIGLSAH